MVPSEKRFEDIKTTIFSLLVPERNGLSLRHLNQMYEENCGGQIPFREFGYLRLVDFLGAMQDKIYIQSDTGISVAKAIPTIKSGHISTLIAGQKTSTRRPLRPPRRLYSPRPYYMAVPVQRIFIPAEVQHRLINIVCQESGCLTKMEALHFLQQSIPRGSVSMEDLDALLHRLSHRIEVRNDRLFEYIPVQETSRQTQTAPLNGHCSKAEPVEFCAGGSECAADLLTCDDNSDDFTFVPGGCNPSSVSKGKSVISKPSSNFIRNSVSKSHNESRDDQLQNTIEKKRKEIDKGTSSPNYLKTEDINGLDNNIYFNYKAVNTLINDKLKSKLEKLIEKYPEGIWCAKLPEKFQEEYKVPLNYMELGFSSIREFASHLPEIFHCKAVNGSADYMLYSAKLEIPESTNKLTGRDSRLPEPEVNQVDILEGEKEALPSVVSSDICRTLIPDVVLTIGECVPQLSVANLSSSIEIYLEVVVVEIFTPSFFWVQLRSHQKLFKSFMDELGSFYKTADLQYTIPPVVLEEGLNCVCKYNNIWHRGIIKVVKPDLQVTVFFYDYGTLKTYPASELRYLHRSFSQLPAQAIPCGLVNTKPYGDTVKWTRTACRKFTLRVSQIPLIATVASINAEDNSMMITLTDTSEEEDVHLNDWLVEEKLAVHGKMVSTKRRNFAFQYYMECRKRLRGLLSVTSSNRPSQATNSDCFHSQRNPNDIIILDNTNTYPRNVKSLTIDKNSNRKNSASHFEDNDSDRKVVIGEGKSGSEQSCRAELATNVNVERVQLTNGNTVHQYPFISRNRLHRNLKEQCNNDSVHELVLPKFNKKSFDDDEEPDMLYLGRPYGGNSEQNCDIIEIDWQKLLAASATQSLRNASIKRFIHFNVAQESYAKFKERQQTNVPTYSCFLQAVRNSVDCNVSKKELDWSPTGNIDDDKQDKVMSALKQIQKRKDYSSENLIIALSTETLNKLRDAGVLLNASSSSPVSEVIEKNGSTEGNGECNETSVEVGADTTKSITVVQTQRQEEKDGNYEKLEETDSSGGSLDEAVGKLKLEVKTNPAEESLEDEEEYETTTLEEKNECSSSSSSQEKNSEIVSDTCRLSFQEANLDRIAREEAINNAIIRKLRMLSAFEMSADISTETDPLLSSSNPTVESSSTESEVEDTEDVEDKEIDNIEYTKVDEVEETDIGTSSSLFETSTESPVRNRAEEAEESQISETVETLQSETEEEKVEEQALLLRSNTPVFCDIDVNEDDENFDVQVRVSDYFKMQT